MRTLLLLGTAAASLLGAAHSASAFAQNPPPALDYGTPGAPDDRVYAGYADRAPAASEAPPPRPDAVYGGSYDADGRWTGAWDGNGQPAATPYSGDYDASGRWTGTWDGTFQAPDGRFYRGYYQGTVEGRPGTSYAPPPPAPASAPAPVPPGSYYSTIYPGGGRGQGYSYGYGGYSPGSVTITSPPPVVTETVETTTETFYE